MENKSKATGGNTPSRFLFASTTAQEPVVDIIQTVECPICSKRISKNGANVHVNECLRIGSSSSSSSKKAMPKSTTAAPSIEMLNNKSLHGKDHSIPSVVVTSHSENIPLTVTETSNKELKTKKKSKLKLKKSKNTKLSGIDGDGIEYVRKQKEDDKWKKEEEALKSKLAITFNFLTMAHQEPTDGGLQLEIPVPSNIPPRSLFQRCKLSSKRNFPKLKIGEQIYTSKAAAISNTEVVESSPRGRELHANDMADYLDDDEISSDEESFSVSSFFIHSQTSNHEVENMKDICESMREYEMGAKLFYQEVKRIEYAMLITPRSRQRFRFSTACNIPKRPFPFQNEFVARNLKRLRECRNEKAQEELYSSSSLLGQTKKKSKNKDESESSTKVTNPSKTNARPRVSPTDISLENNQNSVSPKRPSTSSVYHSSSPLVIVSKTAGPDILDHQFSQSSPSPTRLSPKPPLEILDNLVTIDEDTSPLPQEKRTRYNSHSGLIGSRSGDGGGGGGSNAQTIHKDKIDGAMDALAPLPSTPGWLKIVAQNGAKLRAGISMDEVTPVVATLPFNSTYKFTKVAYCFPREEHAHLLIPVIRLYITLDKNNNNHNNHFMNGSASGWISLTGRKVDQHLPISEILPSRRCSNCNQELCMLSEVDRNNHKCAPNRLRDAFNLGSKKSSLQKQAMESSSVPIPLHNTSPNRLNDSMVTNPSSISSFVHNTQHGSSFTERDSTPQVSQETTASLELRWKQKQEERLKAQYVPTQQVTHSSTYQDISTSQIGDKVTKSANHHQNHHQSPRLFNINVSNTTFGANQAVVDEWSAIDRVQMMNSPRHSLQTQRTQAKSRLSNNLQSQQTSASTTTTTSVPTSSRPCPSALVTASTAAGNQGNQSRSSTSTALTQEDRKRLAMAKQLEWKRKQEAKQLQQKVTSKNSTANDQHTPLLQLGKYGERCPGCDVPFASLKLWQEHAQTQHVNQCMASLLF